MTKIYAYGLLLITIMPSMLLATPCITASYDQPFPEASDVEMHMADVPSARYPAFWQAGYYNGFAYKIFSNGEAVVLSNPQSTDWKIELGCDDKTKKCTYDSKGDVPAKAVQAAEDIGQCLLGQPKIAEIIEAVEDVIVVETPPKPTVNIGECDATAVPQGGTIETLQRLLIVSGVNPGPVDGRIGSRTLNALKSILGDEDTPTDLDLALEKLRQTICAKK